MMREDVVSVNETREATGFTLQAPLRLVELREHFNDAIHFVIIVIEVRREAEHPFAWGADDSLFFQFAMKSQQFATVVHCGADDA